MAGRIRRKLLEARIPAQASDEALICPLCERVIPPGHEDAHHLVPKSKGGVQTRILHRICHRQIHALLTETELARHYHSIEALRSHPPLAQFLAWVQRKPADFNERTRKSARLRQR